jgi:sugar lactone lactonase YvrE
MRLPLRWTSICLLLALTHTAFAADVATIAGNGKDDFSGDGGPALKASLGQPFGLEIGPENALYICEYSSHIIRRMDLKSGTLSTVAGTPRKPGYSGDGGPATAAQMNQPHELRFDDKGHIYISDMLGQAIRRIDAKSGIITSVAGTGKAGFNGDGGPAAMASFDQPISVVVDRNSGLLICDIRNHRIRHVDLASGLIRTFAGTGEKLATPDGSLIDGTPLHGPRTLAIDGDGNVIIVLREGNAVFRANLKTRTLHHLAGTGKSGYSGDGSDARQAQLAGPKGVAVDRDGNILLCDTENHCIRILRTSGVIDTLVGDGKVGDGPDGEPRRCRLNRPHGVFVDKTGSVYIGDSSNNKIRKLTK